MYIDVAQATKPLVEIWPISQASTFNINYLTDLQLKAPNDIAQGHLLTTLLT